MNQLISIIVPVYNVELYLDKCLKSIVNQSYQNIEIILVDDGSKDNSSSICDKWALLDKRIKVIHQENRGVSAARNVGLDIAKGELIGFVDPDDEIELDMYESMIRNMNISNADIVACGVRESFVDGSNRIYRHGDNPIRFDTYESITKALMNSDDIGGCVWDKLWKHKVIKNIRFDTKLKIAEDRLFCISALINSKSFYRDFEPKYICKKREESVTQCSFTKKNFDIVWSAEKAQKKVLNYSNEYDIFANYHVLSACFEIIHSLYKNNSVKNYKVEYKKMLTIIKGISLDNIPDKVSEKFKFQLRLLRSHSKLYRFLWRLKKL